jgi:hypothetical protein
MIKELSRVFHTAVAFQGVRSFKNELHGMENTPQGQEFAKALAAAVIHGCPADGIVAQVTNAMGGNDDLAKKIFGEVLEIAKAQVEAHTRTLPNGKMVNVHAYESARTAAMKGTSNAHGATFQAMHVRTPEAHKNAASMHREAAKLHDEAHEIHPRDVPEVGQEHAKLKGQHQMAVDYHEGEAERIKNESAYSQKKGDASEATQAAGKAATTHDSEKLNRAAAEAHTKAHEVGPDKGHGAVAEMHTRHADAAQAANRAAQSPLKKPGVPQAAEASMAAYKATHEAHKQGTPELHAKAAEAHRAATDQHLEVHGAQEHNDEGYHGKISKLHMKLQAYHADKAGKQQEQPVAKAEGCEGAPAGHDLADQKGMDAMKVEGRPDKKLKKGTMEEDEEEAAKAEKPKDDKAVQVAAYETHKGVAADKSAAALAATSEASSTEGHTQAGAAHTQAAEINREAAKYAPEKWMKEGHEQQAALHDHYAQAHTNKAKASGQAADTGVDAPRNSAQSIAELENHPEFLGHGYLGSKKRTPETDANLAEAANRGGVDPHHLQAWILSAAGRLAMDEIPEDKEEQIAAFQRDLSDPKTEKTHGLKAYAKTLKANDPANQKKEDGEPAAKKS